MNTIPKYQQTPEGIMYILQLFNRHNISYLLFKCDHIFAGQNKNLDILFETDIDYKKASFILEQHNFVIQLSEKIEKYKTMYVGLYKNDPSRPLSIHLHREVAWHGMKTLDKPPLFEHKQTITHLIIIPSLEDSILIHAAHILFENFNITEKEKIYLSKIDNKNINLQYIRQQIKKNHWRKGFNQVMQTYKEKRTSLAKKIIITSWVEKVSKEPLTAIYLSLKIVKKMLRPLINTQRGTLIALIGVNGSGKSTLTKTLLDKYLPLTSLFHKPQHYYYFGWHPEFPLTKLLSFLNKKTNIISFKETNINPKKKEQKSSLNLKQELNYLYIWLEFLYRYYKNIYPKLKQNHLVITDRYFYDLYGQNLYSKKSYLLKVLLPLFPKPSCTFILDTDIMTIQKRKKTDKNDKNIHQIERNKLPNTYLQIQRENYLAFAKQYQIPIIDATQNIEKCSKEIIKKTWSEIV